MTHHSPNRGSSQALRVAIYEPQGGGGICHYTHQLAQGLSELGADVTVFTREGYELRLLARPFRVNTQIERSQLKHAARRLAARLRRPGPGRAVVTPHQDTPPRRSGRGDSLTRWAIIWLETLYTLITGRWNIVHFQWITDPGRDHLVVRALRALGVPVVYTAHNLLPHEAPTDEDRIRYARLYRTVDRVIVHAESNKEQIVRDFDVAPHRVSVIPHGTYDLFFRAAPLTKCDARKRLGLRSEQRVILFFGAIRRYKGLEYLVDALPMIRSSVPDAFLLVVGTMFGNESERTHCSAVLSKLTSGDGARHVAEYVPLDAIESYFAASDVVALPYVETYQSGVLLLAYAAGRAVVVTNTGGMTEIVDEGKNGLVVPPGDANALAAALIDILRSRERIDEMGRHSLHLGTTRYAWRHVAAMTLEMYGEVLGSSPKRGGTLGAENSRPAPSLTHR